MGSVDCTHLAQNRDQWWALVDTVMNSQVLRIVGISLVAEEFLASEEGLVSMEFVI
jgi:hypothetical protein